MQADALICSHPRSGGRWLRFLVAHYLSAQYRLGFTVTPESVFSVVPDHHTESRRGYPAFEFASHRELPLVSVCHHPYRPSLHRGLPTIFLARNPYDLMVSAFFYLTEKGEFRGSMGELVRHPKLGLAHWIDYMNRWAPRLVGHRDAVFVAYRELDRAPEDALARILEFLDDPADPRMIRASVARAATLRSARLIRTGQEGNFWDHLQPEEIFDIQEGVQRGLEPSAVHLLEMIGVELGPVPRTGQ